MQYLKIYATCIPVRGKSRSVICDTDHKRMKFIPNSMFDWIQDLKTASLDEYKESLQEDELKIMKEYEEFIIQNDLGFYCTKEELDLFPEYSKSYESPCVIENAIVDANDESNHHYASIFEQLESLGCVAVQLRFFDELSINKIETILSLLDVSSIVSVDLVLQYTKEWTNNQVVNFLDKYPRVFRFTLSGFPESISAYPNENEAHLICSTTNITSSNHCGFVKPEYFRLSLSTVIEARDFNNCLNKKISISVDGSIKNCPAMIESYGHITNQSLKEVVKNESYLSKWFLKKDDIDICQDCEFRYICSDCRAFTVEQGNLQSKPLKCGYNPETMEWSKWSTNSLKNAGVELNA